MVKKTNILLVNPSCLDERITDGDAQIIPIGLYYIAAQLLENGYQTQLLNLANTKQNPLVQFGQIVTQHKFDIIGFSVTNPNRHNAIACARTVKKINPDTVIVFGGPAPTFMPDHLFEACPELDFIVTGEGEITFLELITALDDKWYPPVALVQPIKRFWSIEKSQAIDQIKGLLYKNGELFSKTLTRKPLGNLDDLVHPSKYFEFQHLAMSRGCPGNCTFCGSPKFWGNRQVRFHSATWFVDEIQILVKKGVTHFFISDDTFTMDKQRVLECCKLIKKKKLSITWNAISRVDYIDEDLLCEMRMAGCIQISYGVESGSKKIRKVLGKPIDSKKITTTFALTRSYGIMPRAYFIYGSPQETKKTIQQSMDLLKAIQPFSAVFYMLVLFPGTYLYESAKQKKLVTDSIWYQKIEDLPWFDIDSDLDFEKVKTFGTSLRTCFYNNLNTFAKDIDLVEEKKLYPFHADFLSRLAMTFSHGEYANDQRVKEPQKTAKTLFKKALSYAPQPRAFLGLAMVLQKQGQFEKAIEIIKKGLSHTPNDIDLKICLGVCLMNLKQFNSALGIFEPLDHLPQTHHYAKICRQQISGRQ